MDYIEEVLNNWWYSLTTLDAPKNYKKVHNFYLPEQAFWLGVKAARSQWIDCSVELPDYWTDVLVLRTMNGMDVGYCFEHSSGANQWCIAGTSGTQDFMEYPTHWQPLPPLPLPPNAQQERN